MEKKELKNNINYIQKFNYHTHTKRCGHADNEKILKYAEYIKTAIEKKIPDINILAKI